MGSVAWSKSGSLARHMLERKLRSGPSPSLRPAWTALTCLRHFASNGDGQPTALRPCRAGGRSPALAARAAA
eukprot:8947942-Pyramimonas_sp.AAC.1